MGLVPLVLSQTALFTPMAISLMSGLIVSTLLTLIVVPVLFASVLNSANWIQKKEVLKPLKIAWVKN